MADLRVLVIADDALARAGLAALLAGRPGLVLAGQVAAAGDLTAAVDVYLPDVVLWDLGWDPASGLARLADLAVALGPLRPPPVVLLPDPGRAGEAWAAGARVMLRRDASADQIAAALTAAGQGLAVLDPALAATLVAARREGPELPVETLTPRETDVLRLMAEGLSNKAIARRLSVSEHTVKFHVNAILGKLAVESRTEAVVRATRLGLVLL